MQHTSSQLQCDMTVKRAFSHLDVGNFKLNYLLEHPYKWMQSLA